MISTALSSKALKDLTASEIIELCTYSHVHKIEWDSVHIPSDNRGLIKEIEKHCRLNSLLPVAYNSNIILGGNKDIFEQFDVAYECAKLLRVPAINVLIGLKHDSSEEKYNELVEETRVICEKAKKMIVNIIPSHGSVVCDCNSALKFLSDVYKTNLKLYWTPNRLKSVEENKEVIKKVIKYTTNIYISNTDKVGNVSPLFEAKTTWREYGKIIRSDRSRLHLFILEELPPDNTSSLGREFAALRRILAGIRK